MTLRDKLIPSPVLHTPPPAYRPPSSLARHSSSANHTASFQADAAFPRPRRERAQIINQSSKLPHISRRRVHSQASQHDHPYQEESLLSEEIASANADIEKVASDLESAKFSPEVLRKKKLSLWSPELRTPSRMVKRSMPRSEAKSVKEGVGSR